MKTYKVIESGIEYEVHEYLNGDKIWLKNNMIHRENGPAIIYFNGKAYYLYDVWHEDILSDDEWLIKQIIT